VNGRVGARPAAAPAGAPAPARVLGASSPPGRRLLRDRLTDVGRPCDGRRDGRPAWRNWQRTRLVIGRFRVRIPVPAPLSSQVSSLCFVGDHSDWASDVTTTAERLGGVTQCVVLRVDVGPHREGRVTVPEPRGDHRDRDGLGAGPGAPTGARRVPWPLVDPARWVLTPRGRNQDPARSRRPYLAWEGSRRCGPRGREACTCRTGCTPCMAPCPGSEGPPSGADPTDRARCVPWHPVCSR
jgi:hypothetical protein